MIKLFKLIAWLREQKNHICWCFRGAVYLFVSKRGTLWDGFGVAATLAADVEGGGETL